MTDPSAQSAREAANVRGSARKGSKPAPDADLLRSIEANLVGRCERLIKLRRRIHATPESSGQERETTSLVAEAMREYGFEPTIMSDAVGVIADLDIDASASTVIALRSELDAVTVNDDKQVPYASTHPGLCHACGHDVHTTINLAVAATLAEHQQDLVRLDFRHNLRFLFQPAEETADGARSMIKQGALDGVEGIIAVHVDPFIDVGKIGLRSGPLTSACKLFQVIVRGRSGHTARPFEAIDPIPAMTTVVDLFYQLCPRSVDARYPMVLTVASIQAGKSHNAIPDEAIITGTLRATRVIELEAVQRRMESIVGGVREATGCEIEIHFTHSCPATDNDPRIVKLLGGVVEEVVGRDGAMWLDVPSLGGEDFAYYQELIPGAMVRLGAAMEDRRARTPLHSSHFDINEKAILVGARIMAWSLLRLASSFAGTHA